MLLSQELLLAPYEIILTGFESGQQQLDLFPIVQQQHTVLEFLHTNKNINTNISKLDY